MPRVAHVTTVDMSLSLLLLNQLQSLQQAGYDVAGISAPGPYLPTLADAGIRHIPIPMTRRISPLNDLVCLWRLYRLMRRERFTIVHTHTPKPGLLGQVAARLAGVPVVVNTLHGFYFHEKMSPAARRFYVTLEKVAARCSDVILSQSAEDLQTAVREGICPPEKIKLLGNGIDLRRFDRRALDETVVERTRRDLGLRPGEPVVGFVGRLVAEKGILELLEAARLIRERVPGVRFLIVGPIDHDKADALTPEIARAYGVEEVCIFTGLRRDMPELYALMTVFVLPSHREGFPRAPMEASAMGVPCVATDIRGCREAVEHGRSGLLVPLGDVPTLADAVTGMLTDPERAGCMGEAGRRLAEERFDEQKVFQTVKSEYARLLEVKGLIPPLPGSGRPTGRRVADERLELNTMKEGLRYSTVVKRLLDLALTLGATALLWPVILLVALLVRLKLGAPVLFRQQRPGLNGQPFTLFKFRTMTDARDPDGRLLPDADRLTPFGQFLRKASLDELPTLVNVLRGEMSLVGPRPLLMHYLDLYTPEQARRHEVRPGITGWAQINGRNSLSWEDKFALDVWYVDHLSLALDLKILLLTVQKVLRRQGISHEGHATMAEFTGSPAREAR